MKHPLNHCSMHKVHAFSRSGEPVWYIEILRCMQIQSFLRISTSYFSARRLFPNVKPTVPFLPTRSYGRCGILLVSWQNSLGYKSEPDEDFCNKNPMLAGFNGSNHVLDWRRSTSFWYQIIEGWNIPKCLNQTRAHMHCLLLSWFS